jgi:uncharacterized coiled-coil DUF342 family protein
MTPLTVPSPIARASTNSVNHRDEMRNSEENRNQIIALTNRVNELSEALGSALGRLNDYEQSLARVTASLVPVEKTRPAKST